MNYTQSIGDVVELQCIAKFIELGYEVSIPYGNGAKYDFVVDVNGKFIRIQCKSCSHPKSRALNQEYDLSAIQISTQSQTTNTQKTTRHLYSKEQIDYFATYYDSQVYVIPVEECSTSKTLRFFPPQNGNLNYNKAENYEIEKFFSYSEDLLKTKKEYEDRTKIINSATELHCKSCGTQITVYSDSGLCSKCHAKTTRVVERPTREELKKMIRKFPFTYLGQKYGVSDKAITKWCVAENLPSRKKDINAISDEDWSKI